jgi:hypothetical protein
MPFGGRGHAHGTMTVLPTAQTAGLRTGQTTAQTVVLVTGPRPSVWVQALRTSSGSFFLLSLSAFAGAGKPS